MTEITPNILKCIERLRERRPMTLDSVNDFPVRDVKEALGILQRQAIMAAKFREIGERLKKRASHGADGSSPLSFW
jgi:hypothetical protein